MIRAARAWALLVLVIALAASACGDSKSSAATNGLAGKSIKPLAADLVPSQVLGLQTAQEDVSKALATGRRAYVETTSMYSFRKEDLLEATMQVSRFIGSADYQSDKFRGTLISAIGGVQATTVRVANQVVYLTAANQQRIAVWFKGPYLFIVATREDFGQPRALVRQLVGINPA